VTLNDECFCDDFSPDKDAQKQMILKELGEIYSSTIEPVESLYHYKDLGVNSFTGILNYVLLTVISC